MQPEEPANPLSIITPVLVATLICDVAVADPTSGKKNIIGVFDRIYVSKLPAKRPMSLYLKVTDASGDYELETRYVQVSTNKVLAKATGKMHAKDMLSSLDMILPFPPLPIPEPGRYEFQVWANNSFLGSTFIDVAVTPAPKKE
jgi:hypothetical protein